MSAIVVLRLSGTSGWHKKGLKEGADDLLQGDDAASFMFEARSRKWRDSSKPGWGRRRREGA